MSHQNLSCKSCRQQFVPICELINKGCPSYIDDMKTDIRARKKQTRAAYVWGKQPRYRTKAKRKLKGFRGGN